MRMVFGICLLVVSLASRAGACESAVCQVDPDNLHLSRVITFDDLPSGFGVGRMIETVLVQDGAQFGERFAGQIVTAEGDFDRVHGDAISPLTVIPGAPGQTFGVLRLMATSVLNGYGPAGYPKDNAGGEGALAFVFDFDQSTLGLDIRGGELGSATLTFFRRDGSTIHVMTLGPLSETSYGFRRAGDQPDIAGVLIENADPQGIALDNIRFNDVIELSLLTR